MAGENNVEQITSKLDKVQVAGNGNHSGESATTGGKQGDLCNYWTIGLRWLTFVTRDLVKEENVNGNEAKAEVEDDDEEEEDGEGEGEGCK